MESWNAGVHPHEVMRIEGSSMRGRERESEEQSSEEKRQPVEDAEACYGGEREKKTGYLRSSNINPITI